MTITIAVIVLLGLIIGTPVVTETRSLAEELPDAVSTLADDYENLSQQVPFLPSVELGDQVDGTGEGDVLSSGLVENGAEIITSIGSSVFSVAFNLFVVIVVSIYLLFEPQSYANSFLSLIPKNRQARFLQVMVDLRQSLVGWLVSQLISMTITAGMTAFMLGVVWGIPNAIALGALAGLLTFIPNFGPFVSMLVGLIFTLTAKPALFIPVLITYIAIQQLEASIITPTVIKYRLSIPAAALLIFQLVAGVLFGFMGLLLAVPMFMVVMVLVRDLYVEDVLDNINTAIESRDTDEGETVLRVKSDRYQTAEIPLKQIFPEDPNPFERTLAQVLGGNSERQPDASEEESLPPPLDSDSEDR
jgi:predicted PurR-regulated permease PerM